MPAQQELFGLALPEGFEYREEFVSAVEEMALLAAIAGLPLTEARYKGYTARRRVASFGSRYDFDENRLQPAEPLPDFALPLRERAAKWVGVAPEALAAMLVAEYRPSTPLGWHRDVPDYEIVVGVSLGAWARMRLRPYRPLRPLESTKGRSRGDSTPSGGGGGRLPPPGGAFKSDVLTLDLAPRSAYVMRGVARWGWQHSIAPTQALRHSITFRTRRATLTR